MKNLLLLIALFSFSIMSAKTADEVRIYLNAGHGSWGPNDRPMPTIPYPNLTSTGRPDTCGFYESNTDLWKILKMGETLEKMGVKHENIMYSRVKNGPYPYVAGAADAEKYNRNLSEICREVDANNMDMFVSIHSNAATEGSTSNYPLYLYRGTDAAESVAGSKAMCQASWLPHYMDEIDPQGGASFSRTKTYIKGDLTFYNAGGSTTTTVKGSHYGYLGALRHGTPGFLLEGFFHTYQPARHRALNMDYCHQEGVRTARGVCDYFGLNPEPTGYIMGTVKDLHEKIVDNLFKYAEGSIDQWLPLNGAIVKLMKDGVEVARYNVDNNYNGVFVFSDLQPGNYKVVASHPGYRPQGDYTEGSISSEYEALVATSMADVVVSANTTSYLKVYLEAKGDNYEFRTLVDKQAAEVLVGKTIRRSILKDESLFVLALDENNAPYVYQIDPKTQTLIKQISTAGTQGSILPLSDIAFTADGVLIGCNKAATTHEGSNSFIAYKWIDFDSAPVQWFSSKLSGNFINAEDGQTMAYCGTSVEGKLVTSAVTTGDSRQIRWLIFDVKSGAMSNCIRNQDGSNYSTLKYGEDFCLNVSPRSYKNFIVDGSNTTPIEFVISDLDQTAPTILGQISSSLVPNAANHSSFIVADGNAIMVNPSVIAGKVTAVNLFNITKGLQNAMLITTTAIPLSAQAPQKIAIEGEATCSYAGAGAEVKQVKDASDNVIREDITVSVLSDEVISLYTTEPKREVVSTRGDYAYDLSAEETPTDYVFKFKSTGYVENAKIVLTPISGGQSIEVEIGEVAEGDNSFILSRRAYAGNYNWSVVLHNEKIAGYNKFWSFKPTGNGTNCTRGLTIDSNPESPYFQNIYISNPYGTTGKGVYEVSPALSVVNPSSPYFNAEFSKGSTTSSPFRMSVNPNDGTVYISDWSDGHSGIYTFSPDNTTSVGQFFNGTRQSSGAFISNGNIIGGSTTGLSFYGMGENTIMFAFQEDYPSDGKSGNVIAQYNIGMAHSTSSVPAKTFPNASAKLPNGNVNLVAIENGMFASQTRSTGQNLPENPSFIYVDYNDNVLFNSSVLSDLSGCAGSGLAINNERTLLAVATGTSNGSSGNPDINIYNVTWTNNVPSFTLRATLSQSIGVINQMAFDHAGNLFVAGATGGAIAVSIPKDECDVVTPARKTLLYRGIVSTTLESLYRERGSVGGVYNIECANGLSGVKAFSAGGKHYLVIKDSEDAVWNKVSQPEGYKSLKLSDAYQNDYDQSNWMIIETHDASNYVGKSLSSVTGVLTNSSNVMMSDATVVVCGDAEPYIENVYCPTNFMGASEVAVVTSQNQTSNYFFMLPKRCEFATVIYAMWGGRDNPDSFFIPEKEGNINSQGFRGGFNVDWSFNTNSSGEFSGSSDLVNLTNPYKFEAIIMQNVDDEGSTNASRKAAADTSSPLSELYTVYPLNLTDSSIVTEVTELDNLRTVTGVKYYDISGHESDNPFNGVNIVVTRYSDGSTTTAKVLK